jgi:nitrite reductase/ring-hydroxylating ferredoxin subunit
LGVSGLIPLCPLDALADPGSRGFTLELDGGPVDLFVVRFAGRLHAYRNSCPHTGATLEWVPNRFLDAEEASIQCGLHGALFLIDSGECVRGPCVGAFLEPLAVAVRGGEVCLLDVEREPVS